MSIAAPFGRLSPSMSFAGASDAAFVYFTSLQGTRTAGI